MTYTITKNEQFNSLEISFDGKPCEVIRDALKALKFRWHGVRRVWYGYADEATTRAALDGVNGSAVPAEDQHGKPSRPTEKKPAAVLASLWERCNVSDIPDHDRRLDTKTICTEVRAHLKHRFPEVKCTVRKSGYNSIDADIVASPYGRELVKGDPEACTDRARWDHWENSAELDAVLTYCEAFLQSYNYDNSDVMTDYFDVNFYGRFGIAYEYTQTEPTPEQSASAADFAQCKAEAEAAEEARRAAEWEERKKQLDQERAEAERLEAIRAEQANEIADHITVADLPEVDQIAVIGLLEAYGKENTLDEVWESIYERRAEGRESRADAVISRKIHFTDANIFENFCTMFLCDFDFLTRKGGTATEDVRVTLDNVDKLNDRQRESVKFYLCDCIGVYLNDVFQFVIDPQGFGYARYILIPDDATDSYQAPEKLAEWREPSEHLPSFYFPAPLAEQITTADLQPGEQFTMLHLDPWIMTATTTAATLNSATVTDYAQYKGAARIEYTPQGKRNPDVLHVTPGQACTIWRGILPDVPEHIKYTDCGGNLQQVNFAGEGAQDYMIHAIEYYKSLGFAPIVDTIQR